MTTRIALVALVTLGAAACREDGVGWRPRDFGGGDDLGHAAPADLGRPDLGPGPDGGAVGPGGGSVDRLFFGITGDTRPDNCGTAYPQAIIEGIFTQMKGQGVEFAVDQGDHMFNCGTDLAAARDQMDHYMRAAALLGRPVFMTMGNHECSGSSSKLCTLASYGSNANFTAFMDALAPTAKKPYYRFDVMTRAGLAVFLLVADDVWDAAERDWLEAQLSDADAHARYTFVSKHHPDGNRDHPEFQQIYDQVRRHKYTLFLTGHSHYYKHQPRDPRALVMGCGGAPLNSGSGLMVWGYGTVLQGPDDRIYVSVYNEVTGDAVDQFSVDPQ